MRNSYLNNKTDYRNVIIASAILHLLFFVILGLMVDFKLFANNDKLYDNFNKDSIIFEFERPLEVVETPEDAKTNKAPENAKLASDKNALARNPEMNRDLKLGDAFSRGDLAFRELPMNKHPEGAEGALAESEQLRQDPEWNEAKINEETSVFYTLNYYSREFKREYLTNPNRATNVGAAVDISKVRYDNQNSRTPDMGGLSFNTYNWDFAPYMLALKRKVERNIFPPPAFTYMGMISGDTLLRFTILPNGEMKGLEVLEYRGHDTLMHTSVRAIEISAPFPPLPANFPESSLKVTASFSYFVQKHRTN